MSVPSEGEMRTMLNTLPRLRPAGVQRRTRVVLAGPRPAPEVQHVVGHGAAFAEVIKEWTPYLRRKAWSLSHEDPDLTSDLLQEAAITLWEMDPTRYGKGDRGLLRTAMVRRMRDVAHKLRRRSVCSREGPLLVAWTGRGGGQLHRSGKVRGRQWDSDQEV